MEKLWSIPYEKPSISKELIAAYNPLLGSVLALRGINTIKAAEEFLATPDSLPLFPEELPGMEEAVARIRLAQERSERVVVYGDYDVDGITATCLLSEYLSSCGLDCKPYIPNRESEGYGLNCEAVQSFREEGISLIITVDCGITAVEESRFAAELGMDVIITDHHECKSGVLPEAYAVTDCKLQNYTGRYKHLAGVGMAFMLAYAHSGKSSSITEAYCDLVAVGTIADVMPLDNDENRYFVKRGIEKLMKKPRVGLSELMKASGLDPSKLTATAVGFTLAPRLNAAGRLEKATTALELLQSRIPSEAKELADRLCELNKQRQAIELNIWHQACGMLADRIPDAPIVLSSESWQQGVIGIAASKLSEQYCLPTIMICIKGDKGKGSCRSYGDFNLYDALKACEAELESFGGHALAAGLNIRTDKIESFRAAITSYYRSHLPAREPDQKCDVYLRSASVLTEGNVKSLNLLEPYGNGNQKPVFCLCNAEVIEIRSIGNGRHTKFTVCHSGRLFECVWFGHGSETMGVDVHEFADLAFYPQINEFRGKPSIQLLISAVRKHEPGGLCSHILSDGDAYAWAGAQYCPERNDSIKVWRVLKANGGRAPRSFEEIFSLCPAELSPESFCLALRVFYDAGLLTSPDGQVLGASVSERTGKTDLEATTLMKALRLEAQ